MTAIRVENLSDAALAEVLVAVAAEVDARLQRARVGLVEAAAARMEAARLRAEAEEPG